MLLDDEKSSNLTEKTAQSELYYTEEVFDWEASSETAPPIKSKEEAQCIPYEDFKSFPENLESVLQLYNTRYEIPSFYQLAELNTKPGFFRLLFLIGVALDTFLFI